MHGLGRNPSRKSRAHWVDWAVLVCGGGGGGRQFLEDPRDDAQETLAHRKPPATLTIFFHFILRF